MPPRHSSKPDIESDLRDSLSALGDLSNAPVADILAHLGFNKVQYSEIPHTIRRAIYEALMEIDMEEGCYGMPRIDMFAGVTPWPENFQISASADFGTIYFYFDIESGGRRHINMSQIRNTDKGYRAIPIAKDAGIDACISSIISNQRTVSVIESARRAMQEL
jgi:hypothetical protein